jgi:hypothetical protein
VEYGRSGILRGLDLLYGRVLEGLISTESSIQASTSIRFKVDIR